MFCNNCGKQHPDDAKFCTDCGAKFDAPESAPANEQEQQQQQEQQQEQQQAGKQDFSKKVEGFFNPNDYGPNNGSVEFVDAVKLFFKNSFNFKGRASKSEYWWSFLFNFLASLVLNIIPVLGQIAAIALMVPAISCEVRRLHDVGKPWYYILLSLIPCGIGTILLIVLFLIKDSDGDNMWGPAV